MDTWLRESITNQENVFTKGPNIVWKCRILGSKIEYYFKVCMLILWEWTRGSGGASLIKKMCSTLRIYFWLATHKEVKLFLKRAFLILKLKTVAVWTDAKNEDHFCVFMCRFLESKGNFVQANPWYMKENWFRTEIIYLDIFKI